MIKVLTETQEEYEFMKEIAEKEKEKGVFIQLHKPEESVADVVWSIEDVRDYFPEGTSDENIHDGMLKIEKSLKERMMEIGWNVIDTLKEYLLENIRTKEDEEW